MEFVVGLIFIFSVMAFFAAVDAFAQIMKVRDRLDGIKIMVNAYAERTERVLDLTQDVLNNNEKMLKYIDTLEKHIGKEELNDVLRENDI